MSTKIETTAAGQKFIRLEIPNYNHDEDSSRHPLTYLHLGAAVDGGPAGSKMEGDDLLDLVGVGEYPYFKDDWRFKNSRTHPDTVYTRDDGHVSETSDPETLTTELRTRGGWRLHTDGNYVSTTRGDRIDVIYGSYKMVVLGRMDISSGDWGETYWESSGGHTRWATNTQGDMVMVKWNADRDRWRTVEETIKGDSIERYQGIVEEVYECPQMICRVGSSDADGSTVIPKSAVSSTTGPHTQTDEDDCWQNPSDRKKERPNIKETVVAKTITGKTKVASSLGSETDGPAAGTIQTDTTITSKKSESTTALLIMDETTCDGGVTIDSQTGFRAELAGSTITSENLRINDYQSILLSLVNFSFDSYTTRKKQGFSNWTLNVNLVAASIDISLFNEVSTIPNFTASPPNRFELGITLGTTTDIWIGTSIDVNVTASFTIKAVEALNISIPDKAEVTLLVTEAEMQETNMEAGLITVKPLDFSARANTTET